MANKLQTFIRGLSKKAINYYVTVVTPSSDKWTSVMGNVPNLSDSAIIANFETIPDLFLITDYVAQKCASIPVRVVKRSGAPAKNSELNRLVEYPNQYQSWEELIKLFFGYYEPLGNSYLYGVKPDSMPIVTSLYCLPADKVKVVLLRDKDLPSWMNEVSGYRVSIMGRDFDLPPDMVLHEKYFSLRYDSGAWVYGISKYVPGDKINRELKAIHDAKTSIIEQRGALGFITNESEVPDPVATKEVKDRLKTNYGVGGDQDKFIVTTEKLRWQQMLTGVQELQLIENAKYSFAKMCQLNGFDPVIFSTEGSTFANKETAEKDFIRKVVKSKVDRFYRSLNTWLSPGYNGDRIEPDWSQVEELQDDQKVLTDLLDKQIGNGLITPYRAAKILYGDDVEDNPPPDTYYIKSSLKPINELEPEQPEQVVDPARLAELMAENPEMNEEQVQQMMEQGVI